MKKYALLIFTFFITLPHSFAQSSGLKKGVKFESPPLFDAMELDKYHSWVSEEKVWVSAPFHNNSCYTLTKLVEVQRPAIGADVLFVMDCSGSMEDKRLKVANSFRSYISEISHGVDVDFRFGVINADVKGRDYCGQLQGTPPILSHKDKGSLKILSNRAYSLFGEDEAGFASLDTFLENDNGFLRKDAYLIIVFATDEEEQSGINYREMVKKVQAIKSKNRILALGILSNIKSEQVGYKEFVKEINKWTFNDFEGLDIIDIDGGVASELAKVGHASRKFVNVGEELLVGFDFSKHLIRTESVRANTVKVSADYERYLDFSYENPGQVSFKVGVGKIEQWLKMGKQVFPVQVTLCHDVPVKKKKHYDPYKMPKILRQRTGLPQV